MATASLATAGVGAAASAPAARKRTEALTIARAAALAGVGVETIRFYEREGLIAQPPKPARGYRVYPVSTVREIRFLRHCQELGFTLRQAHEMVGLRDCGAACAQVSLKIKELDEQIAALHRLRDDLKRLLRRRPSGACGVMETLQQSGVLRG